MATLEYPHIERSGDGTLLLAGTMTKVVEVVMDRLAFHWDADEIQRQHPHLTLGQIHSALAYYYDHQAEVDAVIDSRIRKEDEILRELGESPLRARLRAARRAS